MRSDEVLLLLQGARLLVIGGADEALADSISLESLPIRFGRSRENDVTLNHPLVSRAHCEIFLDDGKICVRDLGSLNGTYVGNLRIETSELRPGELLTVGVVTFRAVYGGYDHELSLDVLHESPLADEECQDTIPLQSLAAERTVIQPRRKSGRQKGDSPSP
jgi:pSer/pThr/pTyr-binding forkhead associated (FHA) protein